MSRRNAFQLSILLMLYGVPVTCASDTMRCGSNLVALGDAKYVVLKKCGKPESIQVISSAIERNIEEWYYDSSAASFPQLLTFEGYRLISIQTISRQVR